MALDRKYQKIFGGSLTPTGNISVYGTKKEGNVSYSDNLDLIQSNNWLLGMIGGTSSDKAPYLQDLNGIFYTITKQLAYIFQAGIPEWESQTEYFANKSFVSYGGNIYIALQDNTNKQPNTELAYWQVVNKDIFLNNGLSFENTYSYKKNDCVNYTDYYGNTIKVFSLVDNNTQEPTTANVYNVKSKMEVDYVVSAAPAATSENHHKKILDTTDNSIKECISLSGNYMWMTVIQGGLGVVGAKENDINSLYEKSTGKYYDLKNSVYVDVTTLGFSWVNKEIYVMDSGFYENAWYKLYSNNMVEQGGKKTITPTTQDTYQDVRCDLPILLDENIKIQSMLVYNTYYKQKTDVSGFTVSKGARIEIWIYLYRNSSDSWHQDTIYWEVKGFASQYKNNAELLEA